MTQAFTTESLQALFAFPLRDPNWKTKLLIGVLLVVVGMFIPIVPLFVLGGYCAQIMRRMIVEGGDPYLPEWDDWGRLLTDGLRVYGAGFVLMLPLGLLFLLGYGLLISPAFLAAWMDAAEAEAQAPVLIFPMFLGTLGGMAVFGIAMLLVFVASALLPPAIAHVVAKNEFTAAFRFSEWWRIFRANLGGFLIAYGLVMGLYIILGFALQIVSMTIVLCCVLPILSAAVGVYVMLIANVLFAQAYREGRDKLALQEQAGVS
jgi:hypothetical protein